MTYLYSFLGQLVTVLVFAGVTYILGVRRHRAAHIAWAIVTTLVLLWVIHLAESLGRQLAFDRTAYLVHMPSVALTSLSFIFVVGFGVALARGKHVRSKHRTSVLTFLFSLIPTAISGIWLVSTAKPL
ncbi:MAG: hypothetical protein HZB70_02835 [Candidatus Berkelbacteria bacterium]|nr:MAG: hypothetical protein HZB70_02835 [Candidatus Berkelbacteria bacterium]QQG51759.1 MAG: hypothetical protein HY845_00160 [Candidatus Berkelbacteria bacterium]